VTDANIVLGRIDPGAVFGDGVAIDRDRAERAIAGLAEQLSMSAIETALGVVEVVESHMERAIGTVSVSEGYDARAAALVAFGGAGALHAAALSTRLDMASVIVPNHAGVFSAVGLLLSPIRIDVTVPSLDLDPAHIDALAHDAVAEVESAFAEAVGTLPETVELWALARYAGQSHELAVAIEPGGGTDRLIASFGAEHRQRNGFAREGDPVELVGVRATATSPSGIDVPTPVPSTPSERRRAVHTGQSFEQVDVLGRGGLAAGSVVSGPAVVEDGGSTIWIPPGYTATVLVGGELELCR
jgi:N-methylhydantoinase A